MLFKFWNKKKKKNALLGFDLENNEYTQRVVLLAWTPVYS